MENSATVRSRDHTKGVPRTRENPSHPRGRTEVADVQQQQNDSRTTAGDLVARQQPVQHAAKVAEARRTQERYQTPTHSMHEKVMKHPNRQVRETPGKMQPNHRALNHTKPHSVEKQTM